MSSPRPLRLFFLATALAPLLLLTSACNRQPAAGRDVAIVNLASIAIASGHDQARIANLQARSAEITQRLANLQSQLDRELAATQPSPGSSPETTSTTSSSTSPIPHPTSHIPSSRAATIQLLRRQIDQQRANARAELAAYEQKMVAQFRTDVLPVISRVAQQQRVRVVILSGDHLLWVSPDADLTEAVVQQIQQDKAAATATK